MANPQQQQTGRDIQALEGLEAVRKRPGMYVGGTDIHALHHLVYEVVDNSIDEAMAGRCDLIQVVIHPDSSITVRDNGGGIPVETHWQYPIPTLELVMTKLHAGGKFGSGAYTVSGGLHGVGVKAVNALSEWCYVDVYRDGYVWRQTYSRGNKTSDLEALREMEPGESTGTSISFYPDADIFMGVREEIDFSFKTLSDRFREMAYVVAGVTIHLIDEREQPIPREATFYFEGGLGAFVRYLNRNREAIHAVVAGKGEVPFNMVLEGKSTEAKMEIEFAFQYTDGTNSTELTFANTINTPDGGTHQTGLRTALTRAINTYARKSAFLKEKDANFTGRHTLDGLTAIVSVRHPNPQFESQTKVKLMNPEVNAAAAQVVSEAFNEWLELNPKEGKRIVEKCLSTMRIQDALDKQRELLLGERKSLLANTTLPGKLADCSDKGLGTEVFIVEGDSAGGCFSGDTQIALTDGRAVSFRELVEEQAQGKEHFCYTIRLDGTIGFERVINPRITKQNAEVIRITLDNGETITCTPEHLFMLRDGQYKQAQALTPEDSLMPLYREAMVELPTMLPISGEAREAVAQYNHRIASIERLTERIDVYDIEVPRTHNFALASGVFVHNSAKQGRDRHFQAILPLRGKILNTERATLNKILDSTEIKALISALGTGIRDDFNIDKMRYGRVMVMTDADVDGAHIRTLLLTFFFRFMQPIITHGRLFIAQPPIFRLEYRKQGMYIYPEAGYKEDALLAKYLKNYAEPEKVTVQRYKGLGEMNADQLWETTMNPEKRTVLQVTFDDAAAADRTFDMLMGPEVPPRKKFIMTHSREATLDI